MQDPEQETLLRRDYSTNEDFCVCGGVGKASGKTYDDDDGMSVGSLFQDYYEGGEEQNRTRYDKLYGNDVDRFNVKSNSKIEDGLKKTRWCTDVIFLVIWFAFLAAMGFATYYGAKSGNLNKLLAPVNGDGVLCGSSSGFKNYRFLYLTDLSVGNINSIFDSGVCVEACPTEMSDKLDC